MTWELDSKHSEVGFAVRHMMVSKVRGRFERFDAVVELDADQPANSRVEAHIDAASINTGAPDRDTHLRSADFFDVEQHPTIDFRSTRVERGRGDSFKVTGDLTIRGVTRKVTLDGEVTGPATDPWGNHRVGFSLRGDIDREDFGLTWNQALEAGGFLVGKKVELSIDAEVLEAVAVAA